MFKLVVILITLQAVHISADDQIEMTAKADHVELGVFTTREECLATAPTAAPTIEGQAVTFICAKSHTRES